MIVAGRLPSLELLHLAARGRPSTVPRATGRRPGSCRRCRGSSRRSPRGRARAWHRALARAPASQRRARHDGQRRVRAYAWSTLPDGSFAGDAPAVPAAQPARALAYAIAIAASRSRAQRRRQRVGVVPSDAFAAIVDCPSAPTATPCPERSGPHATCTTGDPMSIDLVDSRCMQELAIVDGDCAHARTALQHAMAAIRRPASTSILTEMRFRLH